MVIPIKPGEVPAVIDAAGADNHGLISPSHVVQRNGEIIGALSVCTVPYVHWWLHTKKAGAGETIRVLDTLNDTLRMTGRAYYIAPCSASSPYLPLMGKLGFEDLGQFNLFRRSL